MADDIKNIEEKLNRLKKSLDSVGQKTLERVIAALKSGGADLDEWNEQLSLFQDKVDNVSNSLSYIAQSFTDSVNELSRQNKYLSSSRDIISQISQTARKTLSIRQGESSLDEKALKQAQDKIKSQREQLIQAKKLGNLTQAQRNEIQGVLDKLDKYQKGLDGVLETHDETNKRLGAAVHLAGSLDKAMSKIGLPNIGIQDAIDETQRLGQEAASLGDKGFKPLSTFAGILKNNLKEALSFTNLIQGAITFTVAAMKGIDDGAGEMAKSMNITYSEALKTRKELTGIANASYDTNVNTKGLQESLLAVNESIGARVSLTEKDLVTFTKMREVAGLTNDEIMGIQRISTLNNDTLDETNQKLLGAAKAYAGKNKLAINEKQILKDVSKASDSLKLSLGGSVEALAEAAIKTRQFGLDLEQAEKISSSLLDFESSIENELSAELLTGKNLNFERARGLALNGDIAGATAEIAKQLGSAEEFSRMNVIQQEALAKSVGMNRDELAKSLTDQIALQKLGAKEGQSAQERYNELKAQGLSQAEIQQKLGKDANADLYEQQNIQEQFNKTVEKLQEIFVNVGNALMPVFDVLSSIFEVVGPIIGAFGQLISFLSPLIKGLVIWKTTMFALQGINKAYLATKKAIFTIEGRSNIAKKLGLVTDEQAVAAVKANNMLQKESVAQSKAANFYKNKTLGTVILTNIQEKIANVYQATRNALEKSYLFIKESISSVLNKQFLLNTKDFLLEKGKLAVEKIQLGIEIAINAAKRLGNALSKKGLMADIGQAVMDSISAVTSGVGKLLGPLAIPLALAAAAGVAALGYSFLKGDDVMSPGDGSQGYGKRTLFGPEGAIQLNNKDTVIAGTDLFKKGDDVMSAPKGAITVSNSNAPKPQPTQDPSAGTNARLDALISATTKVNAIPTLKIQ
jgi:hypothetical protein